MASDDQSRRRGVRASPAKAWKADLGAGETGQGPAAGAVANAIADAVGKRVRDLPLSRERIRQAISA